MSYSVKKRERTTRCFQKDWFLYHEFFDARNPLRDTICSFTVTSLWIPYSPKMNIDKQKGKDLDMEQRPNIVFILSDDQGPYSLGCLHNSELQTPTLDMLAQNGVRFAHCFCASPVCSPARASILTGSIPSRHGVHDWIRAGNLEPDYYELTQKQKAHYDYLVEHKAINYLEGCPTYTEILRNNGYICALAGKWHLGSSAQPQCGFSKWSTIGKGGCDNYMDPDVIEDGKLSFPKEYLTDIITDKALQFIDEFSGQDAPFYLSVNYIAPHTPWEAFSHKKEHLDLYKDCNYEKYYPHLQNHPWASSASIGYNTPEKRAWAFQGYEAAITAMDEGIGKIIEKLKQEGVYENTIIIFTSDNGFNMGHHGLFGKGNATCPTNVYEESITVPFIASWQGHFAQGLVQNTCVSHYDFFPTILEMAGIEHDLDDMQPGKSFLPLLTNEETQEDRSVVIYDEYGATRMIRTPQHKYVHRFPNGPHELYDLVNDSGEEKNLVEEPAYIPIVFQLRKRMLEWFERYTDPAHDGTKEPACGTGQLCRCGKYAEQNQVFF